MIFFDAELHFNVTDLWSKFLLYFFSINWVGFLRLILFEFFLVVDVVLVDGLSCFVILLGCCNMSLSIWRNISSGCCFVLLYGFTISISNLLLEISDADWWLYYCSISYIILFRCFSLITLSFICSWINLLFTLFWVLVFIFVLLF